MRTSNFLSSWAIALSVLRKQLRTDPLILWLNAAVLLLFISLGFYVKLWSSGRVVETLFGATMPYFGMLTNVSNMLLCIATAVCGFSFAILRRVRPGKTDRFLLSSTLAVGLIMIDRTFRLTHILIDMGETTLFKPFMFLLHGLVFVGYIFLFRRKIMESPYMLLLLAVVLLVFGGIIDMAHLEGQGTPAMLEDGSTLLATLNITLYFWLICRRELLRVFSRLSQSAEMEMVRPRR